MSTTLTPDQGTADELPAGRLRRATSASIGRLGGTTGVWLFIVALALASVAVFVTLILPMPAYDEDQLPWLFFAVAFGLAEVGVLHFSVRSQALTISLAEFPLVIGFYFGEPSALVLAQLAGTAIALTVIRRQALTKLAFNLALFSLSSSLAIVVFRAIAPPDLDDLLAWWVSSFAGASVVTLVGAPAIALVISISLRQLQPGALGAGLLFGLIAAVVNTSLALVTVEFLRTNPQALWLVLAPALVAVLGYRAFAAQREREARVEFLYRCAGILARPSGAADPLVEMLSLARDKFRADVAEILVERRAGGRQPTRTSVGPGSAVEAATPIDDDRFATSMAMLPATDTRTSHPGGLHAFAERLAPRRPTDEIRVPLRVDDEVVGTLRLASRAAHRGSFGRDDVRLLETLGMHTGVALRNSGLLASLAESLANVTQLAAAVDSSDDAILELAPDGTIRAWNPATERLFGYAAAEIAGMPVNTLLPPDRLDDASTRFGGLVAGQPTRRGPSEIVRKDGTRLPISASVSPITDHSGMVVGISAIVHDKTAQVEADAALRESVERFRRVFQDSPIGMALVGSDLRWTAVNDALCRFLERSEEALLGQRFDAFVHPDDVAAAEQAIEDMPADEDSRGFSSERRYITASGRTAWARVTQRPLRDDVTGTARLVCMIEDVTDSRSAAQRIRDTEARLHRAVAAFTAVREPASVLRAVLAAARDLLDAEFAAIGILSDDGSSITELHFDGIEERAAAQIGLVPTANGMMGLGSADGGPSRVRDVPAHPASRGILPGHPVITSFIAVPIVFEQRLIARLYAGNKRSGPEFDTEDESVATALAAQAAVVLENARINARTLQLVEELDRANAGLRKANDAKSEFLGTVSHELRTPLHSILVAAELVHDPMFGPLTEERARELGATIQGSGRHLLGLIDDLVDLSRIEADRIEIRLVELPVERLLEEACHEIEPIANDKGVTVSHQCEPGLRIHVDPLRIRQVLTNLLTNAVKFSAPGSRVWVEAVGAPTATRIAVHDTGPGIRESDLARIFEPFEQVSGGASPGAGLGLAIARRLVELHDGRLEVTSTVGVGSTFTVSLPANPPGLRQPLDAESPVAEGVLIGVRPSTILVVEDDVTALGLISDLLRRSGHNVWQASDITEAVERVTAGIPSLVLLDIRLGQEDGLDLARYLRSNPATRDVPILALSADALQHDRERATEAGCDDHLAKPVVARELLGAISSLLESDAEVGSRTGDEPAPRPTSAGGPGA